MSIVNWSITQSGKFEPFDLQVARGQITNHETQFQFGVNTSVGTSVATIWNGPTTTYAYPAAATVLKISSSDTNDTSAGTGARTVLINGLNANYQETSEIVTLNGQTPVNTANSYLRFHYMEVLTAGSGGGAAGTIYAGTGSVTGGVPAVAYGLITSAYNTSAAAMWTVPAGYTAYMTSCVWTSGNTSANVVVTGQIFSRTVGGVFTLESSCKILAGNTFHRNFDQPLIFQEKTDIEMRASSSAAGSQVTGEFHIIYIKNDYP